LKEPGFAHGIPVVADGAGSSRDSGAKHMLKGAGQMETLRCGKLSYWGSGVDVCRKEGLIRIDVA
jgi:hypothetical protein